MNVARFTRRATKVERALVEIRPLTTGGSVYLIGMLFTISNDKMYQCQTWIFFNIFVVYGY